MVNQNLSVMHRNLVVRRASVILQQLEDGEVLNKPYDVAKRIADSIFQGTQNDSREQNLEELTRKMQAKYHQFKYSSPVY